MSFELKGTICHIGDTQHVSDKFRKREFVITITEEINGKTYTNYAKFQTTQNKCDLLDNCTEGQEVTVQFNIKGNKWERDGKENFITSLEAWRIESTGKQPTGNGVPPSNTNNYNPSPAGADDLPF